MFAHSCCAWHSSICGLDLIVDYLLHFTFKSTTHTLDLKPKPLVVRSTDRGRDPGSLKKWHCSPRLWHRSPRRACSKTKTIGSAQ